MQKLSDAALPFAGRRVLITGGLGFIGSTLARALADAGARVTVLDALVPDMGGNRYNLDGCESQVTVCVGDLREAELLSARLPGQEYIFNLAGALSHIDSMRDPQADLALNCASQLALLERCRHLCPGAKIVFAGTRGQYGRARYLPVDEQHPQEPIDINGIHCMAAEQYHLLYGKTHGLRVASLRLTNIYGPRHQMRHGRQGYLNWFVRLALEEKEIKVFAPGTQQRDFVYVDDAVAALLRVAASAAADGEVFNLGSGAGISVLASAEAVIAAAGGGSVSVVPYPPELQRVEIGDYRADSRKLAGLCGWRAEISLAEGLARTVAYYRDCRQHYW